MINPHHAAADGNLNALQQLAAIDRAKLFSKDHNGWTPLHEAARGGHVHVIQYLIEEGASINERTNNGRGASALWWAEHKERTEAIAFLKKHGAVSMESEIHKKQKAVAAESTSPKVDDVDDDDTTKKEVPET